MRSRTDPSGTSEAVDEIPSDQTQISGSNEQPVVNDVIHFDGIEGSDIAFSIFKSLFQKLPDILSKISADNAGSDYLHKASASDTMPQLMLAYACASGQKG